MGCGTGSLTAELVGRESATSVLGLDYSEAYVNYASQHVGREIEESTLTIRMEFESFDDYWAPYVVVMGPTPRSFQPSTMALATH